MRVGAVHVAPSRWLVGLAVWTLYWCFHTGADRVDEEKSYNIPVHTATTHEDKVLKTIVSL